MAPNRPGPAARLLHYSDQGGSYASDDHQALLDARRMTYSMSRRGNRLDAVMESLSSTVKSELGEHSDAYGAAKEELFD